MRISGIELDPTLTPFATPELLPTMTGVGNTVEPQPPTPIIDLSGISLGLLTPPLKIMPMGDSITDGFPVLGARG